MQIDHKSRSAYKVSCEGFALLSAIWIVAILSLMSIALLNNYLSNTRATFFELQRIQSDWLLDAALNYAALSLIAPRDEVVPNATPFSKLVYPQELADVHIEISNESGRIDLTKGAPELIQNLFETLNIPNIVTDNQRGALTSYREIKKALRAYPNAYAQLINLTTLHNGQLGVHPSIASAEVLSLLPDFSAAQRKRLISERSKETRSLTLISTPIEHPLFSDRASSYYRVKLSLRLDQRDYARTHIIQMINQRNTLFNLTATL